MSTQRKVALLSFLFVFFLLPLFSSADIIVPLTNPNDTITQAGPSQFIYHTCQATTASPGTLDLSWKLPSTVFKDKHNYVCKVSCARCASIDARGFCHPPLLNTDPNVLDCNIPPEVSKACRSSSQTCGLHAGNSFVRKNSDRVARFDYPDNSWNIQYPPTTKVSVALQTYDHSVINLMLKEDKVTIPNVVPGNSYMVSCSGPASTGSSGLATTSWVTVGSSNCPSVGTGTTGVPCEVPFKADFFVNSFPASLTVFQITEKDAEGWSQNDSADHVGFDCQSGGNFSTSQNGTGSGDRADIAKMISCQQTCSAGTSALLDSHADGIIDMMQKSFKNGDPLLLAIIGNMRNYPQIDPNSESRHALVAYDMQVGSQVVRIDVIDPNVNANSTSGKHFNHVDCNRLGSSGIGDCHNYPFGTAYMDPFHIQFPQYVRLSDWSAVLIGTNLKDIHDNFCQQQGHSNLHVCQGTAISRLLNGGILDLNNPLTVKGEGSCFSWATLEMDLAYLGDFVGTDFHPDDGKIVDTDCDANHYPITKSAWLNPTNWLGNVFSAWLKF